MDENDGPAPSVMNYKINVCLVGGFDDKSRPSPGDVGVAAEPADQFVQIRRAVRENAPHENALDGRQIVARRRPPERA